MCVWNVELVHIGSIYEDLYRTRVYALNYKILFRHNIEQARDLNKPSAN